MEMSYAYLIKTIDETLEARINGGLRRYNLTASQMRLLMLLKEEKAPCCLKDIEKKVRMSQSTVQGLVARMEKKGFLKTLVHPNDRRVKVIDLTKEGQILLHAAAEALAHTQLWLTEALSGGEKHEFYRLLAKVYESL